VLEGFARCLEPGGRLVLAVPQGRWLMCPLDRELGRKRRYSRKEILDGLSGAGFEAEETMQFNKTGVSLWLLNGVLLRRRRIGRLQLKGFDFFIWLWKFLDVVLPWPGLTLIVVARKRADGRPKG
jgi:hypothetical protein